MKVVVKGTWLYDGAVSMPVEVVSLDYDFWYAIAEANQTLEPDEQPALNPDGCLFYLRFRPAQSHDFWPDSPGFGTVEEAKIAAEERVPGPVTWD